MKEKRYFGKLFFRLGILLFSSFLFFKFGLKTTNKTQSKPSIEKYVEQINKRLHFLKVSPTSLPNIKNEKSNKKYVITVKKEYLKAVYFFDIYQYTIETGGDPTQIQTSSICQVIDNLYNRPEPIFEIISKLKTTGSFSFFKVFGLEIENLQEVVVELLYSIRKLNDYNSKEIDVLVKGYADGKNSEWKKDLKAYPYNYTEIKYLPTLDINSLNPINYAENNNVMKINRQYKNKHLPNLRAKFVKDDLIEKYLNTCINVNVKVNILEGFEYNQINELNRKVQVFITMN